VLSLKYPGPQLFWAIRMLVDWDRSDPAVHPVVVITFVNMFLMVVSALLGLGDHLKTGQL